MKVVINTTFGGFDLPEGFVTNKMAWEIPRTDPALISYLESNPDKMGNCKIVIIPDNIEWEIHDYDGQEWVAEKHRVWA